MPIRRKPGEVLEVDWAGSTLTINDRSNGGKLTVYIFVATFPYSQYSKTGVSKASNGEPILNEAYRELADYYQTVIVPGRVRKPKDKPSVEGTVRFVSRQIIAALRQYQCFDIRDLNQEILKKLNKLNKEAFQKRPGQEKKRLMKKRSPTFTPYVKHDLSYRNGEAQKFNPITIFRSNACITPFPTSISKVTWIFVFQRI